ncbi:multidrug transporter [Altererythrobacter indicus]|uniref:Multidrug transporter n=1 Tax=Altericroceibacterium indicum TaxID=374177 RepID=A0A845ACF0_9SPHN|nr:SapC family protein [Altericroceibacterium indicum]MXP24858.1 multidrug transporter [Altericroceibacterium indicum]
MASAPQSNLPLFYHDLMPLNSRDHAEWKAKSVDKAPWIAGQHAIPLTVDEFARAQRNFPIVFSNSEKPVPLALLGLHEGVNVFFEDDGKAIGDFYVPAYARRYPFLLAKLDSNSDNMSLCFDPSSKLVGKFKEGAELFAEEKPTEHTQELLQFCQRFEEAGQRTQSFVEELQKADLLMDGEVAIQRNGEEQPFIYRGFKMVNQDKLRDVRGDQLRTWNQNGLLPLIFAHLFSLDQMRIIFAKQVEQGKGPSAQPAADLPKTQVN